jgi:hypothetical protein
MSPDLADLRFAKNQGAFTPPQCCRTSPPEDFFAEKKAGISLFAIDHEAINIA